MSIYKQNKMIYNISGNKTITLIKQGKGRGVVILDKSDYIEKCINILYSKQFKKLKEALTKAENKMQRILRKIKQHIDKNEYKRMHPTGSRPDLFYTTAKVQQLQSREELNELTMRPCDLLFLTLEQLHMKQQNS